MYEAENVMFRFTNVSAEEGKERKVSLRKATAARSCLRPSFHPFSPRVFLHTYQYLLVGPHSRALNARARLALWHKTLRNSMCVGVSVGVCKVRGREGGKGDRSRKC